MEKVKNISKFGKSGNPEQVEKYFKFDTENLVKRIKSWKENKFCE